MKPTNENRQLYIDNVRLFLITLVVLMHFAVTYSGFGDWYYVETEELDAAQTVIFGFFQAFLQGFFMGLLFLIAGYYTPESYDKKGFGKFIKDRFIRLGIPTLLYMLIINPLLVFGILGYDTGGGFIASYKDYLTGFHFIGGNGPLWFALALLLFSIIYALLRKTVARKAQANTKNFPEFPNILIFILFLSTCTFLVRLVQPLGTDVLNMQLGYFSQYIILFIVGISCKRNNWFDKLAYKPSGKPWLFSGLILGFILFVLILVLGGGLDGDLSAFEGGLTWQSAAYATWESFICVAMAIGLLSLFKEKANRQSHFVKTLSANAFSVYLFHSIIIVSLSLLFAPITLVPILKFIIVSAIGVPACFLLTNFTIRRIPGLKKIF